MPSVMKELNGAVVGLTSVLTQSSSVTRATLLFTI